MKIAIIGGSGLDDPHILTHRKEIEVETPFGVPSDCLIEGTIGEVPCVLLARHGRDHSISPSDIPFRANIWALKEIGCTHLLVSTACGSLQENIEPGHLVILDSFIDHTFLRKGTFHDGTIRERPGICHLPMGNPFNDQLRSLLIESCQELKFSHHSTGTVVTIEGPRFSTKAESRMFRAWGADVINMTTCPEAALANEAGLLYASIAMATDYDAWREAEESVTVDAVMKIIST
eukprot:Sdes_comp22419_c0_seq1m20874